MRGRRRSAVHPMSRGFFRLACATAVAAAIACCDRDERAAAPQTASVAANPRPDNARDLSKPEYGEFYARPEELAPVPVNDIVKSMRLNATAMALGEQVYAKACASCHGADLKGIPAQHTPNLTDADWRFAGDDIETGGATRYPSDVEWTVRYGIRSGSPNARGLEADMVAFDPALRSEEDKREYGTRRFLTPEEIGDVVEYVLKIGGQEFNPTKAARGDALFHDARTGNCADCHGPDGTGDATLGSTDLTRPDLYLWGADRSSIADSIHRGRHGVMAAFEGMLKPEEIKAVSVYVFSSAAH